ncbi:MAG TPA: hypothetical protein VFI29_00420 [Hanamia sp.]|nr:hypothetical protein [Hanamia sp.]
MKKIYRCLFVCITFFSVLPNVKAQDSTKSDGTDKSYFEAGLSYLSNNVYSGRHDSLRIPYLTPSFNYYNKSGFYAGTSLSYMTSAGNRRVDLVEIEAGYAFTKNKFSGIISAEKDFYNSQSKNVRAETKGSLNGTFSYDFGFIKPLLQGGIVFNTRDDYYAAFGLGHSFFFADDNLEVNPSLLINAGTQNYYNSYYTKRKFATKRKDQTGSGTTIKAYLPNVSNFKIMDYEFSLPVDYSLGKFVFDITPTEAFPVNPNVVELTVTPPSGIPVSRTKIENLNNIFFFSAGITYSF